MALLALTRVVRRAGAAALLFQSMHSSTFAATLRVPHDFPTIAAGCAASIVGDSVVVACGEYFESDIVVPSGIVLIGEGPGICVTIDANQQGRILRQDAGSPETEIAGFRFVGGLSSQGGAIFSDRDLDLIVRSCEFVGNRSDYGGAIYSIGRLDGGLIVEDCRFLGNSAKAYGGAISADVAIVRDSEFLDNDAGWGGAFQTSGHYWGPSLVERCRFEGNSSDVAGGAMRVAYCEVADCEFSRNSSSIVGGAISTDFQVAVLRSRFEENSATDSGGAIHLSLYLIDDTGPVPGSEVQECDFLGNTSGSGGGAIEQIGSGRARYNGSSFSLNQSVIGGGVRVAGGSAVFGECLFFDNEATARGGAIDASSTLWLTQCTLVRNRSPIGGGVNFQGVYPHSPLRIMRSILSHSIAGSGLAYPPGAWLQWIQCTDIFGNSGGDWVGALQFFLGEEGNFSLDPIYCNSAEGNFGLSSVSPCAPENSGVCGRIGARDVSCGVVSIRELSWGSLKGLYR